MRNFLFFILLLPLSTHSFAQSPIIKRNEVDKFTKKHIKETSITPCARNGLIQQLSVQARHINGNTLLKFQLTYPTAFHISEGNTIYILFENDSTVEITCSKGELSQPSTGPYVTIWYAEAWYDITTEQIDMIKRNTINSIRVDIGDSVYTEFNSISKKLRGRLKEVLELLDT